MMNKSVASAKEIFIGKSLGSVLGLCLLKNFIFHLNEDKDDTLIRFVDDIKQWEY